MFVSFCFSQKKLTDIASQTHQNVCFVFFFEIFFCRICTQSALVDYVFFSSTPCFFANSYEIDKSCKNYNGNDISRDIQEAIYEVREMAHNALVNIMIRKPNLKPLLDMLFGRNGSRRGQISIYFTIFSQLSSDDDFVVICGDEMVNLITNLSQWTNLRQWDPQIAWVDHDHHWIHHHDGYRPCDPARRPDSPDPLPRAFTVRAFTIRARLIYLCPVVLDNPKGRLLAPYKDRLLAGEHIDDYALTSFILFHELLHTNIIPP